MQNGAARLPDPLDEELARMLGILDRHLHAVAFAPIARCHPAEAALDRNRIFGKVGLACVRRRRDDRRTAMRKHHEMTIPGVGNGGEQIGAARMLGGIAGCNRGDFLRALGCVGDRRTALRECRTAHDRRHDHAQSGQPHRSQCGSHRILPSGIYSTAVRMRRPQSGGKGVHNRFIHRCLAGFGRY